HDNLPGCNSQQEVEDICWNSVKEISSNETFRIIPNPSSGILHIRFSINDPESPQYLDRITTCELFTISGQKIRQVSKEVKMPGTYEIEFDLRDLPAGIYFCTLKTNPEYSGQTKKIIKLD
ncbi:MAG: T9SS type A sorting domain-containing protein, partial [Bacteroidales bacterium]|nr:T9SS type A sorting domain-containing protein [Bacteroidales bacterium]